MHLLPHSLFPPLSPKATILSFFQLVVVSRDCSRQYNMMHACNNRPAHFPTGQFRTQSHICQVHSNQRSYSQYFAISRQLFYLYYRNHHRASYKECKEVVGQLPLLTGISNDLFLPLPHDILSLHLILRGFCSRRGLFYFPKWMRFSKSSYSKMQDQSPHLLHGDARVTRYLDLKMAIFDHIPATRLPFSLQLFGYGFIVYTFLYTSSETNAISKGRYTLEKFLHFFN